MDFHNPKVERAMIEHVRFAAGILRAAFPKEASNNPTIEESTISDLDDLFGGAFRQQMAFAILTYTLGLDYKLRNTLGELAQKNLKAGEILEDLIL